MDADEVARAPDASGSTPPQAAPRGDNAAPDTAERCAGFDRAHGRCVRDAKHPGSHHDKYKETWT